MEKAAFMEAFYKKTNNFVSRRISGEAVLVPLRKKKGDSDHIFSLNETAASVWVILDGNHSMRSVVEQIVAEYEVEDEDAIREAMGLVEELVNIGALEKV